MQNCLSDQTHQTKGHHPFQTTHKHRQHPVTLTADSCHTLFSITSPPLPSVPWCIEPVSYLTVIPSWPHCSALPLSWECIFGFLLQSTANRVFVFVCTLVCVHASLLAAADWSLESRMMMSSLWNTLCHFSTSCSHGKWLFCYWWEMLRGRLRPAGSRSTWLPNMEHDSRAHSHQVHVVAHKESVTWARRWWWSCLSPAIRAWRHIDHSLAVELQLNSYLYYHFTCILFLL